MSLKLFACGDILNTVRVNALVSSSLREIISNCDISICNLEGPVETTPNHRIPKAGPHVCQNLETIKLLKNAGFNFASLANNHILDYGLIGLERTISQLTKFSIDFVGVGYNFEEAYSHKIINKNGVVIALIAACENEFGCLYEKSDLPGYPWLFNSQLDKTICKLRNKVDYIILIAHAGVENIDFPIREWRERYQYLCELGVDIIIGHHSHVPQGIERFNNSIIFYSLGNFYFDHKDSINKTHDSFSIILSLNKNKIFDYEIVYHKKLNGVTTLVSYDNVKFSLNHLNYILEDKNYYKINDAMAVNLFQQYYYNYYITSMGNLPQNQNIITRIKYLLRKLINKRPDQDKLNLLLLHNIRIDTHRFVVQRALSIISENRKT